MLSYDLNLPVSTMSHVKSTSSRYGELLFFDFDAVIGQSLDYYGEWAQNEIEFITSFINHGDVILDAGAHVGVHALAFSHSVGLNGSVMSFEPNPILFQLLQANCQINNLINVLPYNSALGDGLYSLDVTLLEKCVWSNLGAFSLDQLSCDSGVNSVSIDVLTIDSLDLSQLDFIKLDVEGMESAILDGAVKTITALNPVIYLECNSYLAGWECVKRIKNLNYQCYYCFFPAYNQFNIKKNKNNIFSSAEEGALIFIPNFLLKKYDSNLKISYVNSFNTFEELKRLVENTVRYNVKHIGKKHDLYGDKVNITVADDFKKTLENNNLFDERFYLNQCPLLVNSKINPLYHFLTDGWKLGLNPSPFFDVKFYLENNLDVVVSGQNPLLHYIFYGVFEGRAPFHTGG